MAVGEERRLELYRSLEAAHGSRVPATMMEYLPPVIAFTAAASAP